MKLILYCVIFFIGSAVCFGQTQGQTKTVSKCELTVAQAPAIRGIRLQMSLDELLALFPGSNNDATIKDKTVNVDKAPFYGVMSISFKPKNYTTKAQFEGIEEIYVNLFDGRITQIRVTYYDASSPWNHVDEMVIRVSETFQLPGVENWIPVSDAKRKTLECAGFILNVRAFTQESACCSNLDLIMQGIEEKVNERRKVTIQKNKRDFKP